MLHEGGLLSPSDSRSLEQFLIPCTFCDELVVVKGDDRPSSVGLVEIKIWLNKSTKYSLYLVRINRLKRLIPR